MDKKVVKGSLVPIILKLLEDNGRMYGYEMTREVKHRTEGIVHITEAALYPALHKLVEEGILTTTTEQHEGRLRKYYSLTKEGEKKSKEKVEALKSALESIQLIFNPGLKHG